MKLTQNLSYIIVFTLFFCLSGFSYAALIPNGPVGFVNTTGSDVIGVTINYNKNIANEALVPAVAFTTAGSDAPNISSPGKQIALNWTGLGSFKAGNKVGYKFDAEAPLASQLSVDWKLFGGAVRASAGPDPKIFKKGTPIYKNGGISVRDFSFGIERELIGPRVLPATTLTWGKFGTTITQNKAKDRTFRLFGQTEVLINGGTGVYTITGSLQRQLAAGGFGPNLFAGPNALVFNSTADFPKLTNLPPTSGRTVLVDWDLNTTIASLAAGKYLLGMDGSFAWSGATILGGGVTPLKVSSVYNLNTVAEPSVIWLLGLGIFGALSIGRRK